MRQPLRWFVMIMTTIILIVAIGGCGPAEQPTEEPAQPPATQPSAPSTDEETPAVQEPIIIGFWLESATLNPYYQTGPEPPSWMVVEGLIGISAEGTYIPQLVKEVPTQENGLVSEDGLVITYELLDGLVWSDGEPVTSADIRFTWEAILNPANSVARTLNHDLILSVETPDELTAVVTLSEPFVAYQGLFPALLPEHILGELESLDDADYNRNPVGTGPYTVVEWVAGSHIEYERNPYYREEGKPLTERMVMKFLPSREAGIAQLRSGEVDVLIDVSATELDTLKEDPDIYISIQESMLSERLFLNLSDPNNESQSHPILGDVNVRAALDFAIDRTSIIDGLLGGQGSPATCDLPRGAFGDPGIEPTPFDPDRARELLDEAGWEVGPDGIRTKDGMRLSIRISSSSGNQLRELEEQLFQEMFKDVGVELVIENKPSAIFWGSFAEGGPLFTGDFDILLYATGPGITGAFLDPHAHMYSYYHSTSIPTMANNHVGGNYMRYANTEVDAALDQAGSVLDVLARQQAYSTAMRLIAADRPVIFLYNRVGFNAYRTNVKGWVDNPWLPLTPNWDTQNWYKE